MAGFDLTANINAQINAGQVRIKAKQLKRQLSVNADVNLRINKRATRTVGGLNTGLKKLNKELIDISNNSKNATQSLAGLSRVLQNLNNATSQARKTQQNLNKVGTSAKTAGTQLEQFGRQAGLAFRRFAGFRIATSVVSGFFGATVQATGEAISFQRELVRISQVSGRSLTSLGTLTKTITDLSINLGVASSELIGISRILTQAGLSANQTEQALEALAKSSLAPTFTDINKTAEGAIAIFRQFGLQAKQLESALGSINAVSGKFAVESDDIISAVKRAGGVFAALSKTLDQDATTSLNQFIATFTSVRATTRESADSIATGLRTIFTRIQRPTTIAFLRDLGVELTDLEGKFIGPFDAINAISDAFANLDSRDPRFARITEELGGFRQVSRVIPLLTEQETRLRALQVAQEGFNSLTKDTEIAQQALSVQFTKVREEFAALIREFTDSSSFQNIVKGTLDLARAFIRLADSIQPILPLISVFAGFKAVSGLQQFTKGILGRGAIRFNQGGEVPRQNFAVGGIVPGGRGIKDDFDTTLPSGAFVIKRKSVDTLGRKVLEDINKKQGFAKGGEVPVSLTRGEFIIDPKTAKNLGPDVLNLLNNADRIKRNQGGFIDEDEISNILGRPLSREEARRASLREKKLAVRADRRQSTRNLRTSFVSNETIGQRTTRRISQGISSFSRGPGRRGINRIPRRTLAAIGGSRLARNTGRIGGALGTVGFFAGSQIGGSTGAAISGASAGGLAGASIGGPIGAGVGAVIGGVSAALNSLAQSRIDAKVKKAADGVNKALDSVQKQLNNFKPGNVTEALKSLEGIGLVSQDIVEADRAQNDKSFFDTFSDNVLSSIGRRAGLIGTGAAVGSQGAAIPGAIAGAGLTALASIAGDLGRGPEGSVTREQVRNDEVDRRISDRRRGEDIASQLAPAGELAQKVFEDQIKSGKSFTSVLESISGDQAIALASSLGTGRTREAIGGANGAEARSIVARASLRDILPPIAARIKREQDLSKAISESNLQIDRFNITLEDMSAKISRASDAGSNFGDINDAIVGNGVQRVSRQNPFANPNAFSQTELSAAARQTVVGLGGSESLGVGRELIQIVDSFSRLKDELPNAILNAGNRADGDQESAILTAIQSRFEGSIPNRVLEAISTNIRSNFQDNDNVDPRELAQNSRDLFGDITDATLESLKKYNNAINRATSEYSQAVNQWIGLQDQANNTFDSTVGRAFQDRNNIISQDRNLTFNELTEGFRTQQSARANRAGADNSSLPSILNRLGQLDSERANVQARAEQFRNRGGSPQEGALITDAFRQISIQESEAQAVLKQIATNTTITAAATRKLQEIEQTKKTSQQLAEEFLTADTSKRSEIQRQSQLGNLLRSGVTLEGKDAADALQGIRRDGGLAGQDPRVTQRVISNILANNTGVQQQFARQGRNAREAIVGGGNEEQRLRRIQQQQAGLRVQAGTALGDRQQNQANDFLNNARQQFRAVINDLGSILNDTADKLSQIPSNIQLGGNFAINVNVNGAENFNSTTEDKIKEIASVIVKNEINKVIPPDQQLEGNA